MLENEILDLLKKCGKNGISQKNLRSNLKNKHIDMEEIDNELNSLKKNGKVYSEDGVLYYSESLGFFAAEIVSCTEKFCFAEKLENKEQIFILAKDSKGAFPGDFVLVLPTVQNDTSSSRCKEGKVKAIFKFSTNKLTGTVFKNNGKLMFKPDIFLSGEFEVEKGSSKLKSEDSKIVVKVLKRGTENKNHIVKIVAECGNCKTAAACAKAMAIVNGVEFEFPSEVLEEANNIEKKSNIKKLESTRLNLTNEIIFTIDSEQSKDLDDAISIKKLKNYYELSVHIADVSHYVEENSKVDREAFKRATSTYYANQVIPMLPPSISNGICSLNQAAERLAFSAILEVDFSGDIIDFSFKKTIIKSKVKGIYEELNEILDGSKDEALLKKYKPIIPSLKIMVELYEILKLKKIKKGSPQIETTESKIYVDEKNYTIDIKRRQPGKCEEIIEEFMILANEAAATLAKRENLPFVYRVHKSPEEEKITNLKNLVEKLGLESKEIRPKLEQKALSKLLNQAKNTRLFQIINNNVLRTMAKAEYDSKPIGHYGLVLENYCHFTSPIRRYSDLAVHRVLTDFILKKEDSKTLKKRYSNFVKKSAKQATKCEKQAQKIERTAESFFKAEYMKSRVGQQFEGIIVSIVKRGMFVALENTIEGFVRIESLEGFYTCHEGFRLECKQNGRYFEIGQKVKVLCIAANIPMGKVDFKVL